MGPREATSGLRGINKWKKGEQQGKKGRKSRSNRCKQDEQQVDEIATGGNGNSAEVGSSQPDKRVEPGSQRAR